MNIKQTKGITLIALVITIIVLLILAAVSIAMLTGENGILTKASTAKEQTTEAEFEEQVKIAVMSAKANATGKIDKTLLKTELEKITGITGVPENATTELPWTVIKEKYKVIINENGEIETEQEKTPQIDYGTKKPEEDQRTVLEQAKAAMPTGTNIDTNNNNPATGIVMIDSNQNQWVWIEVPNTVFTTATSSSDYDKIKANLITYAGAYREGKKGQNCNWIDEWYNGCGLTQEQYTEKYQKMLGSIYTNKGFYIGRYEAGIDGSDENANLLRTSRTEITSATPRAVSKPDMIPYNYINCSDAEKLAEGMTVEGKTVSLMFGIQWDLACKFLEVKGTATADINENSINWGNYKENSFTIDSSKAKKLNGSSYETITGTKSGTILLTTGASNKNKKMNIYDFAGNEWELTLEHATTSSSIPCSNRGGGYGSNAPDRPLTFRSYIKATDTYDTLSFRPTLY